MMLRRGPGHAVFLRDDLLERSRGVLTARQYFDDAAPNRLGEDLEGVHSQRLCQFAPTFAGTDI